MRPGTLPELRLALSHEGTTPLVKTYSKERVSQDIIPDTLLGHGQLYAQSSRIGNILGR